MTFRTRSRGVGCRPPSSMASIACCWRSRSRKEQLGRGEHSARLPDSQPRIEGRAVLSAHSTGTPTSPLRANRSPATPRRACISQAFCFPGQAYRGLPVGISCRIEAARKPARGRERGLGRAWGPVGVRLSRGSDSRDRRRNCGIGRTREDFGHEGRRQRRRCGDLFDPHPSALGSAAEQQWSLGRPEGSAVTWAEVVAVVVLHCSSEHRL